MTRPPKYFPPDVAMFDANGAKVRDLLGMRSGLTDPAYYDYFVEHGSIAEAVEAIPPPHGPPGSAVAYANVNYALLGLIIEHITGRSLAVSIEADVLNRPGFERFAYGARNAFAADGWEIMADASSLARWGYELYGGSVLSDVSLDQMLNFDGEFYGLRGDRLHAPRGRGRV
jgi:CubicO group peptidase (beta-lactamase class C family)